MKASKIYLSRFLQIVLIVVLVLGLSRSLFATTATSLPFTTRDLVGEWESVGCGNLSLGEGLPVVNLKRHYVWSDTNFVVRYSFFADAECQRPLYSFVSTGPYELGQVRPELRNTREATIFIESMFFIAQSEEGRQALGNCGEQLIVGELKDVTETGCAFFPPRGECLGDHELFRVENGFFYPGSRTPNMCHESGRPTQTQTTGARKL
ncbi:hypothetical protein [Leptolyngbya sp. FACHB-261]|uniref:hypothetical protein n=1 Tax=Leptolyngbya sp. FACHB-261 TaxID=2692806 RepID=UPI0016860696|nr:hypothetical protein [Leptolyngbya sp. FACHB-261]MBD2100990.1 hypothetical protein [Leptolyngbya sp. FACHB-261]